MKEKHVRFIENYVEFSQQGIDWLRERIELEEIQFISFSEYAKKLFAENDMAEIMLAELLKESSKLICLVGPQGCGKSSTAVKVIETVKERHSLIKIFYFNYRIIDAARSDKHRISYDFIKSKILEELQTEIEITGKDGILTTQRLDFYYFLLKPELEQTVKFETSDLNKLRNTLMIHFNAERRKDEAFHKYFYTELPKSQFFADFHTELLEAIDIPHYLYYFTHTQKYSYCVFWLDNIDAFSHIEREELVNIAHKMEMNMMTKASFVVAVREENIYRVGKFQDSVNEPFLTKVSFADTADEKYNAVNSALIKDGMLLDILDRVADYIPDYQHKKISSLERQKKIIENKDSKPIEIEEIGKQIIHEKSLLLLDTDITVIKGLIKTLFDIFKKEKIILLANNSIREFKSLFSTHLKHVYENHVDHEKMRINLSDSDLTTNLLSWIPGNQDSQFRLNIFNVISDGYDHEKGHSERIDCLIPYLILNRIWNENIRLSARDDIPTNNPEIEFLVRELIKDFGFEREEILQSLLFLGNTQDHKNGYIAFRSKKEIRTIGDIDAESTVRITFKGKVSIGYTMNSFGYLSYCSKKSNMSILEQPNPEMAVISDITKLSEYHIKSLSTLKNRFEANGNWLDKYLMKYGIPLDPKFVRNPDIGIPIQNITFRRCLLMESIYDSLGRYFKMENPAKKLLTESVINFNNALKKI